MLLLPGLASAGKADVIDVKATPGGNGTYSFSVTVLHTDEGWKHYADKWEVLSPEGEVIGTRILLHPHENEQPFTRSLSGIQIPTAVKSVTIRAHDLKHGWGGKTVTIALPVKD